MNEVNGVDEACILCGKSLSSGARVNKEHYVPATMIRQFNLLQIPSRFNWALRVNQYQSGINEPKEEQILVPLARHKEWATVRVHEKCNQDASVMCRHMSDIIRNLDKKPTKEQVDSITGYYAHLWGVKEAFLTTDGGIPQGDMMLLYRPGLLSAGRFVVWAEQAAQNDFEKHTIYLGVESAFTNKFHCASCGQRTMEPIDGCFVCTSCRYCAG